MIVEKIKYSSKFVKRFGKLSDEMQELAIKKEKLFRLDPLHPSLRLHQLQGGLKKYWSISVTENFRIVFRRLPDGSVVFVSIGKHDIYRKL